MKSISTEFVAHVLQHYSALVIIGKEKSGKSLIAIDILKEKIKINNKLNFTIFTSTSDVVYRKHFPQAVIFKDDDLDELNKIQKKFIESSNNDNKGTSYVLILDDCGRKMFEQINLIITNCSNYNIYIILIPSPIHMECIDWKEHNFDYIVKANKSKSMFEVNKKCIDFINSDILYDFSENDTDTDDDTEIPNISDISFKHHDCDVKFDKKPDFTIEQLQQKEYIPKKETLIKYKYSIRPELLKKDTEITTMIDKFFLSM